jgi:hypothetical protein
MDNLLQAFRRNPDGSWFCVAPIRLEHPTGRIEVAAGSTFVEGGDFMGVDLAAWLTAAHRQMQPPES